VAKLIQKIPQLTGGPVQQAAQLREHINRVVDEINRALQEKDREIERLRKETKTNERK
jgi:hypothetical protein